MKKFSVFCIASTIAVASALAVSAMVGNPSTQNQVEVKEIRSNTNFVVLTAVANGKGKAKLGLGDYTVNVEFDFETGVITDRVSGEQYREFEVTSIHDVVVRDLSGEQIYDFTDHMDHQQFVAMIQHKLMEY